VPKHEVRPLVLLVVAGCTSLGACSLIVDRSHQCVVDDDCAVFEDHPVCRTGVCVSSGLGPRGCFFGAPKNQEDFANACTVAHTACIPFDNCKRLGICDKRFPDDLAMPNQGTASSIVNMQPTPTMPCAHPSRPNLIYATGSTNLLPLLEAVAPILAENDPPYRVVYQPQSSCKGAGSMFETDPSKRMIKDIPNNWAFFFDEAGQKNYCLLQPEGNFVDIGESDVYANTCGYDPKPTEVGDYMGPIQAITFVVHAKSSQKAISAEAAHILFGAGGRMGAVAPWDDPLFYFVRGSGTGTIQLTSRAIKVPATGWWGIDRLSSDNLRDSLNAVAPTGIEKAIGVLSSDFADKARKNLRVLAFQGVNQTCGYLPDSTQMSFDKENVRDGHYPIWGPIHFYAALTNGVAPTQQAEALIKLLSVPKLEKNLVDAVVTAGYIPACAMRVSREEEMGDMTSRPPDFGCGCYYEKVANGQPTPTCRPCSTSAQCTPERPSCNYGFCEVQ
jgi:ABC-type phosphate transport system substrate-binding protein